MPHFMLKEIHEQPRAIRDTLRGRIGTDDAITLDSELGNPRILTEAERISISSRWARHCMPHMSESS